MTRGSLAAALRDARTEAGLTQEKLGKRAGLHRSSVGRIEKARAEPSVDTLRRWAEATGTRLVIVLGKR